MRKKYAVSRTKYLKRIGILAIVALSAPLFFLLSNSYQGYGLTLSPSSYIFMMSRLNDAGILDEFLLQNCKTVQYFSCSYEGHFPTGDGFIWDPASPLNIEGWKTAKPEYNTILHDVFTTPQYELQFAEDSVYRSVQLFFMLGMDSYSAYGQNGPIYPQVAKFFPHELGFYLQARQYLGQLESVVTFALIFMVSALLSFFAICFMFFKKMLHQIEKLFVYQVVIFLIINACIMATLSGVFGRYQDRIVWLLPAAFLIFVFERVL